MSVWVYVCVCVCVRVCVSVCARERETDRQTDRQGSLRHLCIYVLLLSPMKEMLNDTLNTFHLRLYCVRHMVKDHSDSERGNLLLPHGLLFPSSSKGSFICIIPTYRITHTTAFVTLVVEHWLEREITQWVHPMKDRSDDPSHHERTLLPRSYISLLLSPLSRLITREL